MYWNRLRKGGNLVEYAIPLALIGVVVGLGIYGIVENKVFFNNIIFSSSGSVDATGGKISFGSGATSNGVFLGTDGKMFISNSNGQSVRIPLTFHDKYKNEIQNYLEQGKFDFKTTPLGVETSGAVGIENVAYAGGASTLMYTTLIDMASTHASDDETKLLLEQMSTYGYKMGEIESQLVEVKKQIDTSFLAFEDRTKFFWKAQSAFDAAKKAYEEKPTDENRELMDKKYNEMQAAYAAYEPAMEAYKEISTEYLDQTKSYFNNLKDSVGVSFDDVLQKIKDSDKIDVEVREFIVPVADKISAIKDSVDLIEKIVNAFSADFNAASQAYEQFSQSFNSFDLIIDENAGDETFDLLDQEFIANQNNGKGKGN
ncbi:MAG: hypothetical protein AB1782_08720 [Cyanobacteriota bacterium]